MDPYSLNSQHLNFIDLDSLESQHLNFIDLDSLDSQNFNFIDLDSLDSQHLSSMDPNSYPKHSQWIRIHCMQNINRSVSIGSKNIYTP